MTVLTAPCEATGIAPEEPRRRGAGSAAEIAEWLTVLAALLWWAWPLTLSSGGRGPVALLVATGLAGLASGVQVARGHIGAVPVAIACLVTAAAVTVFFAAPYGRFGTIQVASYADSPLSVIAVCGFARSPRRRLAVLGAVMLAGLLEFGAALLPWWGGGDPTRELIGTFYWRNPFGAFMATVAVLGLGSAVWRPRPLQVAGWVLAPLGAASVVLSTSRASLAFLLLGWLAVGALALRDSRRSVLRWLAASALAVLVTVGLPGPPLFSHWASPFSATAARGSVAAQSLGNNTSARLTFWREGVDVLAHHPIVGTGYGGFAGAGDSLFEAPEGRTPDVHNSLLQPWIDGGLVLGLTTAAACVAIAAGLFRRRREWPIPGESLPRAAWLVALAVAVGHAAVDVDWTYPASLALAAVLAGVALNRPGRAAIGSPASPRVAVRRCSLVPAVAGIALVGCAAAAGSQLAVWTARTTTADELARTRTASAWPFLDASADTALLNRAGSPAAVDYALSRTGRPAEVDPGLALQRAMAMADVGKLTDAVATVRSVQARLGRFNGPFALREAAVLARSGQSAAALNLARRELGNDLGRHVGIPPNVLALDTWADVYTLAGFAPKQMSDCAAAIVRFRFGASPLSSIDLPAPGPGACRLSDIARKP